jgi:hypothetical protein
MARVSYGEILTLRVELQIEVKAPRYKGEAHIGLSTAVLHSANKIAAMVAIVIITIRLHFILLSLLQNGRGPTSSRQSPKRL